MTDKKIYYVPCAELAESNKRLSAMVNQFNGNMKKLDKCKKELVKIVKDRSEREKK